MDWRLLRYELGEGAEAFSTRRDSVLPYPVITGHQVHGCRVAVVDRSDVTREDLEGYDALVTNLRGHAIGVRTADCVPILLFDSGRGVVAAVHSGWKGTVQRISQKTIFTMMDVYGCRSADIRAAIGPCIGRESFQVGEEVVLMFKEQGFPLEGIWHFNDSTSDIPVESGHHIDLVGANRWLLEEAGVPSASICSAGIDTYRDCDFFSARRDGTETGRTISSIKLI